MGKINVSSLRNRFALVLIIVLLPWIVVNVRNNLAEQEELMRDAEERSLKLLDYLDATERVNLKGIMRIIETALLGRDGQDGGHVDLMKVQMLVDVFGCELPVAITDFGGNVLASSFPLDNEELVRENPQVRAAADTGKISFGSFQGILGPDKYGVVVAYPVIDPSYGIRSIIVGFVDEERLADPLRGLELPADAVFEVADLDGNVVARYSRAKEDMRRGEAMEQAMLKSGAAEISERSRSGFMKLEDGSMQLVAEKIIVDPCGRPTLRVAVTTPAASSLSRMNDHILRDLKALLVVAAIITPVLWGIFRAEVVVPVEKLANLASRLAQGEFGIRHGEPYRRGELGLLARTLDQMSTALERRANELIYLSHHDSLTGAYNRTYIESIEEDLNAEDKLPTTVIVGDINGLKRINDIYGHSVGDEVVIAAGNIFREYVGEKGIVARWAGDEFTAVLPNTDWKEGLVVCREISHSCSQMEPDPVAPNIALGVATRATLEQSLRDTWIAAEDRMYTNKLAGSTSGRGRLLHSLRQALAESTHETQQHSSRLHFLATELGKVMGLSAGALDDLALLADFHDIGKIGIPDAILQKPGPLTPPEWDMMMAHPEIGARIVGGCYELEHIADAILSHHERWDGTGYPNGLAGDEIPLISRILAIVDAYDAMTSDRPYRTAMSRKEALKEIQRCSGTQFDPNLVEVFVKMMEEIDLKEEYEKNWSEGDPYWLCTTLDESKLIGDGGF